MEIDFDKLDLSEWFQEQIKASSYGFVWAARQVPVERRDEIPPQQLGEWTAARHVFHLLYHEQNIALPRIRQWLGGQSPTLDQNAEMLAWSKGHEMEPMLEKFLVLRFEQIKLAAQFEHDAWGQVREIQGWGVVNLRWVYSKNYQHTAEHIHDMLRLALFWDRSLEQNKQV